MAATTKTVVPLSDRKRHAISFAGCGFMGMYHVGVGLALQEYASHEPDKNMYGASAGSIAAVLGTCNISAKEGYKFIKELHDRAHSIAWSWLGRFGALHPRFDLMGRVRSFLERLLPHDAHRLCRGKVGVSLTVVPEMRNWIVSDFNTRAELIQAVVCSCFIPFYCGVMFPKFRGKLCCDGGLSTNLPFCNDPLVITVSPFSGECDICPSCESESYYQLYMFEQTVHINYGNLYKGIGALLFLPWNEMEKVFEQGYNDTINFLRNEGIISMENERLLSPSDECTTIDTATSDYFSITTTPNHSRNPSAVSSIDDMVESKEHQLEEFDTKLYRSPFLPQNTIITQRMDSHWKKFVGKLFKCKPDQVLIAHKLWQLYELLHTRYKLSNFCQSSLSSNSVPFI